MQNRSLFKLFLLNLLTFGFYEFVWLSDTRQEMVTKFGIQISSSKRIFFIEAFQAICILVVYAALFILVPYLNNKISTAPDNRSSSQQCQIDYAAGRPVTDECSKAINTYYSTTSPKQRYSNYLEYTLLGIMAIILVAILSSLIYIAWLKRYALGVATVTKGKISQTRAINYLTLLRLGLGIILVQAAYNEVGPDTSVPGNSINQPSPAT